MLNFKKLLDKVLNGFGVISAIGSVNVTSAQMYSIASINLPANGKYLILAETRDLVSVSHMCYVSIGRSGTPKFEFGAGEQRTTNANGGTASAWKYIETGSSSVTVTARTYGYYTTNNTTTANIIALRVGGGYCVTSVFSRLSAFASHLKGWWSYAEFEEAVDESVDLHERGFYLDSGRKLFALSEKEWSHCPAYIWRHIALNHMANYRNIAKRIQTIRHNILCLFFGINRCECGRSNNEYRGNNVTAFYRQWDYKRRKSFQLSNITASSRKGVMACA